MSQRQSEVIALNVNFFVLMEALLRNIDNNNSFDMQKPGIAMQVYALQHQLHPDDNYPGPAIKRQNFCSVFGASFIIQALGPDKYALTRFHTYNIIAKQQGKTDLAYMVRSAQNATRVHQQKQQPRVLPKTTRKTSINSTSSTTTATSSTATSSTTQSIKQSLMAHGHLPSTKEETANDLRSTPPRVLVDDHHDDEYADARSVSSDSSDDEKNGTAVYLRGFVDARSSSSDEKNDGDSSSEDLDFEEPTADELEARRLTSKPRVSFGKFAN